MKKVVLITNIPNPYRIPLFNELNQQMRDAGMLLKVVFGAAGYERRKFRIDPSEMLFDHRILDDKGHSFSEDGENTVFLYRGLAKVLNEEKPDLIIVSGFSPATLKVFLRKLIKGTPFIIWNGTIRKKGRKDGLLRTMQRKLLCRSASAFVSYGTKAKDYLTELGGPPEKVFIATNTVDTAFFERETAIKRKEQPKVADPRKLFLVLGYLVPRKKIEDLLYAVRILSEKRKDFRVAVLGDGVSKNSLEEYTAQHRLTELVTFEGFVQKPDLPSWFARASALLFQTGYDIWGLVVNESMAAGVPVISSVNAGATFDLIRHGENGFIADYSKPEEVIAAMEWILDHGDAARAMGNKAASDVSEKASLKVSASGFVAAAASVLKT